MKLFTADHHFNHKLLADIREFKNVWAMNNHMVKCWNEVVKPGDIVYHLGDLCFPNKGDGWDVKDILAGLTGQIILILGNHDHKNMGLYKDCKKIVKMVDIEYIKLYKVRRVMLCHYPMLTWRASLHGSWHLHGHCHGNLPEMDGYRLDVGVDCHNFYPLTEYQVINEMQNRKICKIDEKKT